MSLDIYIETIPCKECGRSEESFWANITHNLGKMAAEAGIYDCLWHPGEHGISLAVHLISPLERGIADMKAKPEYYRRFDPDNGWGTYMDFVPWLERLLVACKFNPNGKIKVSI